MDGKPSRCTWAALAVALACGLCGCAGWQRFAVGEPLSLRSLSLHRVGVPLGELGREIAGALGREIAWQEPPSGRVTLVMENASARELLGGFRALLRARGLDLVERREGALAVVRADPLERFAAASSAPGGGPPHTLGGQRDAAGWLGWLQRAALRSLAALGALAALAFGAVQLQAACSRRRAG